eukprot:6907512-Pyramimonas_sp.AAC.1
MERRGSIASLADPRVRRCLGATKSCASSATTMGENRAWMAASRSSAKLTDSWNFSTSMRRVAEGKPRAAAVSSRSALVKAA